MKDYAFEHRRTFLRSRKADMQAEWFAEKFARYAPYFFGAVIGAAVVATFWAATPPIEQQVREHALVLLNHWEREL